MRVVISVSAAASTRLPAGVISESRARLYPVRPFDAGHARRPVAGHPLMAHLIGWWRLRAFGKESAQRVAWAVFRVAPSERRVQADCLPLACLVEVERSECEVTGPVRLFVNDASGRVELAVKLDAGNADGREIGRAHV